MIGTAHLHFLDTMHAEVKVLATVADRFEVEVITGVGSLDKPGKRLTVASDLLGPIDLAQR